MRAVLILNPVSGISTITTLEGIQSSPETNEATILAALRACGIEPEVQYTTPEDTGQGLAAQAALNHAELVIVAGGDGSIHAVACGLLGTGTPLGIIATGTMNNLAHSLRIPTTIEEACAVIARGETRAIDVGKINDHLFIEVAGVGLEAALFPAAEEFKKPGFLSSLRAVCKGLVTLLTYRQATLRIMLDDGKRRAYDALQVTICNAPFYGAHLQAAPDAVMDDGLLDIVIYRHFSKLEYLHHAFSISQGRRVYQPKMRYRKARSARITASIPQQIQADGVAYGQTPATITVMPGVLQVRVPRTANSDNATNGALQRERNTVSHAR